MATAFATYDLSIPTQTRGPSKGLDTRRLMAFSALAIPVSAAQLPIINFLPSIYAQQFGISLAALGTIFLLERVWGVFADPIVGILSDRTRSRFGRRRPWIAVGVVIFALASAALFLPPQGVTPLYLGVALFVFYLAYSMIQIPYWAWSGELSSDYHERTRVAVFYNVATAVALLLIMLLPAAIDQLGLGDDRLKLAVMGGLVLLALAPAAWMTLRAFPERPSPDVSTTKRLGFLATVRIIAQERLILKIILSDLAVTMGQGVRGSLLLFVVAHYVGRPEWGATLMLTQFVFGIAAGPIWLQVARHIGKQRTAIVGELVQVAINLSLLAITPGSLALLISLTIAQGLAQNSGNVMLRAMVSDVADAHHQKTGQDRTALFFSAFSISMKLGLALAVGITLPLVAALGFDPKAAQNTSGALTGLLVVFALGPALAHLASALLLRGFTVDGAASSHGNAGLQRAGTGYR